MSDKVSKTVSVKFSDLLLAYEFANAGDGFESRAYVSRESGKTYCKTGEQELDDDIPEDIDESDDYIALPDKRRLDLGNHLVFAFAEQEMPDDYDTVRTIFRRKGAYGRFKDFLSAEGRLEQWYAFEEKATEDALRAWCRQNNIEPTDT
jgi:Uncharacterised protein family (UPF0158)